MGSVHGRPAGTAEATRLRATPFGPARRPAPADQAPPRRVSVGARLNQCHEFRCHLLAVVRLKVVKLCLSDGRTFIEAGAQVGRAHRCKPPPPIQR